MNRDLPPFIERLKHTVRDLFGIDPEPEAKSETDYYRRYAGAAGTSESNRRRAHLASYAQPVDDSQRDFDEALNEAAGIEPAVRRDTKGVTYFIAPEKLVATVDQLQMTKMAAVATSRMSKFTYQRLRPKGVVGHACKFDNFMAPYLIEVRFNDDTRCFILINGVAS